ncbi:MAG: SpoIIE family protein phosphatase [Phycisphaerae bacterium]|nr:SpoIIE family protein phosphatase [Phycisphaerae bacterium]
MNASQDPLIPPQAILDAINDGIYVTDSDRKIVYWGRAAEKITGWAADDLLGKHCYDDVLCHVDKDGHRLCGQEHCPLHRAIVTGQSSTLPVIVFARHKGGRRVPLQVTVAPIRGPGGDVIGGVETFRDLSSEYTEFQRIKKILALTLQDELPAGDRIRFKSYHLPQDVIGGDYYAVRKLDEDRYGFLLGDVTGHGVCAALYTIYLNSLWESHWDLISRPSEFAETVSGALRDLIREDEPFAASLCGLIDLETGRLHLVGAGNPPPFIIRADGTYEHPRCYGLPLGAIKGATYEESVIDVGRGDCVLFFTDGALEISRGDGEQLGVSGLQEILERLGYPDPGVEFKAIEEELLSASNRIRFDDDLTFLEMRLT